MKFWKQKFIFSFYFFFFFIITFIKIFFLLFLILIHTMFILYIIKNLYMCFNVPFLCSRTNSTSYCHACIIIFIMHWFFLYSCLFRSLFRRTYTHTYIHVWTMNIKSHFKGNMFFGIKFMILCHGCRYLCLRIYICTYACVLYICETRNLRQTHAIENLS